MNKKQLIHIALMAVVLITTAGLSASFLHNRPTYMSDTVTYVEGAQSLAAGEGYARGGNPITTWPPGYSLFLSGLVRCGLDSFVAFKALNVVFAAAATCLLLLLFMRFLTVWEASALALAAGVFFPWIYYTHTILADIPFASTVALFVLLSTLYAESGKFSHLMAASVLCAVAPLIRSAGLALIPVLALLPFLRDLAAQSSPSHRPQITALSLRFAVYSLLPTALALGVWFLRNHAHTGSILGYSVGVTPEYALSLESIGITDPNLFARVWVNLRGYAHVFVIPDQVGIARVAKLPLIVHVACVGMWLVIALGWARRLFNRRTYPIAVAFAGYAGLLLLNAWYDIRYVLPALGLCFLFLYDGIALCINGLAILLERLFPALLGSRATLCRLLSALPRGAFLALLVGGNLAFSVAGPQAGKLRSPQYGGDMQRMYQACEYIRDADGEGSVMVAGGAGFVPLWTGRGVQSILRQVGEDRELASTDIPAQVRFLLLDESKFAPYRKKYMAPVVEANAGRLNEVFRQGDTIVYEVVTNGG